VEAQERTEPVAQTWYVAEIAVLFDFGSESAPMLQNNFVLIQASTPDSALEAAVLLGRQYEANYINTDGSPVLCEFAGIRNLYEIYDGLEHGAELLYEEFTLQSRDEAASFIRPKMDLAVFRCET
jgi:hypothetical protein